MGDIFSAAFLTALFAAGLRMSVPLMFGSLGNVAAERSGVMNIGMEGQMLIGAFFSFVAAVKTGSMTLGILAGGLAGLLAALAAAFWAVSRMQDPSIVGIMLNIFALGFTNFMNRVVFDTANVKTQVEVLPVLEIPGLSNIPVVGAVLFQQNLLTYIAILAALAIFFVLRKTKLGLQIYAAGENPKALQASGTGVRKLRYACYAFGGFMAGVGGAFLPLGIVGEFTENITAGRGFLCLAITILSRWNPMLAIFTSFLFGSVQALQIRLQALGSSLPYQLFVALPYIVTLVTLMLLGRNLRPPKSLGETYDSEAR